MTITAKELREATLRGEGPLAKSADDEPVFLLVGRDSLADEGVDRWAVRASLLVSPTGSQHLANKVTEARQIAEAMRAWTPRKDPD